MITSAEAADSARQPRHIWMPSVRAGSGADVYVQRLADGLRKRGIQVTVDWLSHRYELVPFLLRQVAQPPGVDLIHANAGCAFAFAKWQLPLVVTDHHYVLDPAYRPFKSALQHAYHRFIIGPALHASYAAANVVTTDSQFSQRALRQNAGVVSPIVIPLWADYEEFSPASERCADGGNPFKLFFVGNGSRRKGADLLEPLALRLGDKFQIRCTAGLRANTRQRLPDNVITLGMLSRESLVEAYRQCDAVLSLSRYEGFGYAALESMACGKPVVGFACGAIDEIVGSRGKENLVPVDDLDALVKVIHNLAWDPYKVRLLGRSGRARVVEHFSEERGIDAYLRAYGHAMSEYSP